jgi:DNA repair protein RecN (Recombination protein N)
VQQLSSQAAQARQRADYLRDSIGYIERVDPQPHEDDELKLQRDRIENAAAIMDAVGGALGALDSSQVSEADDAPSVVTLLSSAVSALRSVRNLPDLAALADDLDEVNTKVSDVVFSLSQQMETVDGDDADLDRINERIHDLNELTRRWGPNIEDVRAWHEKASYELEDIDASPEKVDELRKQCAAAREEALAVARELHTARRDAALVLSERVTAELGSLAMAGAKLTVTVTARSGDDALTSSGIDDVEFLFTPFPGAGERPLGKSASGGELSRLMLAMELSLADEVSSTETASSVHVPAMTFVFDEVDAGVGGEAAVELGKRLARLSRSSQVIVVTHLAQVASWADAQFVVEKAERAEGPAAEARVETQVSRVEGTARETEIARMLSGSDSETSLKHARELLKESTL